MVINTILNKVKYALPFLVVVILFNWSCMQEASTNQQALTSLSKEIKEISPGILEGYLPDDKIPNSLELIPSPPEKGSTAFLLDQEIASNFISLMDEKRKEQAVKDVELAFPQATEAFNIILDIKISEETTPHLYMILRRTLADAGLSTYSAKNYYQRTRPFMLNNMAICTPEEEEGLRKDGSYPSGHTAIGWAWALILAEVFPEQANEILERGKQFGISRNVCNVHWHSDVVYGRMMGAATVAALHANSDFVIDLKAAKSEILKLK
ncbi:MAG: phosphatase PAP2 family protein [Bacteroidota bacterium]